MPPAQLTGATRLVCILAHPVDHVRAPQVYNPAFAAVGLDWSLVPMGLHPDDLQATVAQLARVTNLQGLNITIPHKAAAQALCARLGPEAERTGVVNTMRLDADGGWSGESFDGHGFMQAARAHGLWPVDGAVVVFGAGGAGTAIAFALANDGAREIRIVDRDLGRATRLADAVARAFGQVRVHAHAHAHAKAEAEAEAEAGAHVQADAHARLASARLIVNATPLGMHAGDPMPFAPDELHPAAGVFDIVAARDTELVAACRQRGFRAIGGKPMIEQQVAAQIAFWRGADHLLEPLP